MALITVLADFTAETQRAQRKRRGFSCCFSCSFSVLSPRPLRLCGEDAHALAEKMINAANYNKTDFTRIHAIIPDSKEQKQFLKIRATDYKGDGRTGGV